MYIFHRRDLNSRQATTMCLPGSLKYAAEDYILPQGSVVYSWSYGIITSRGQV